MATSDANANIEKLKTFLSYAEQAIAYANKIAPHSFSKAMINQSEYELLKGTRFEQLSEKFNQAQILRKNYLIKVEGIPAIWDDNPPKIDLQSKSYQQYARAWYNANIYATKETGAANCEALCYLAMERLSQILPKEVPVEMFKFVNAPLAGIKKDHVFIVIGRDQTKDPNSPALFGPTAVICDPWAVQFYPADIKNMQEKLYYITKAYKRESGEIQQTSCAFNSRKDDIKVFISNKILFAIPNELIFNVNKSQHVLAEKAAEEKKKLEEEHNKPKKPIDDEFDDIYDDGPSV